MHTIFIIKIIPEMKKENVRRKKNETLNYNNEIENVINKQKKNLLF